MSARRQTVSLAWPPRDRGELQAFPHTVLAEDRDLWRVVGNGRGPWWFNGSGHGRFDLREPEGTCYLATDELSALLEAVGPDRLGGAVSTSFLDARHLRRLRPPRPLSLADLTSRRASGFGFTLEIHTIVPYDLPQAWAASLRDAGAAGLLYFVRHDPAAGHGVAIFGRQGERTSWARGRGQPIGPPLAERLEKECGISVIAVPRLDQLRIARGLRRAREASGAALRVLPAVR
jgi:hypothetical protein